MIDFDSACKMAEEVEQVLNKYGYTADTDGQIFYPWISEAGHVTEMFAAKIKPLTQKETQDGSTK
jgi:hypothetical protein